MADVKWIKIVTDIFDDEKLLLIETLPEADSIIVIWFKLLCLAGKQNNNGVFMMNDKIPYTEKMLATIFRRKEATVQLALKTFEQFGMIEIVNGVVTIPNWGKHQSFDKIEKNNEYMRNYMREYRAKQKLLTQGNLEENEDVKVNSKTNGKVNSKANVSGLDKNREDKNRIDKNNKESNNKSEAKAPDEYVIDLPTNKFNTIQECYCVTDEFYKTMIELYPNVNVLDEFKKMKAWLLTNTSRRKTLKGMEKFINSWLSRQQDNSKGSISNNKTGSGIDWNEWDKKYNQTNNDVDYEELIKKGEVF